MRMVYEHWSVQSRGRGTHYSGNRAGLHDGNCRRRPARARRDRSRDEEAPLAQERYSNDAIGGLNPTGPCTGPHRPSMKNMPGASASDGQWRVDGFLDCL